MTVHVVSLPHTETTRDWCFCAYTEKVRKFCDQLTSVGRDVVLYAGTRNEAHCTEHVELVTDDDRDRWFGHYDWDHDVFDGFQPEAEWWQEMNRRAIDAIRQRAQPGDVVGIIAGRCQQQLVDAFPDLTPCEWGIGYSGVLLNTHHVFESYAWMHTVYAQLGINDGRYFDAVVPNAVDPADFTFRPDHDGYLLFLGRHTARKGLAVVEELAKHYDVVTAGQGDPIPGTHHVGVVRGNERAELLAGARALVCPTSYIEPWGGVAVEAQVSGTPVLTVDWGAFTENVVDSVTGYRCHTLAEFLAAAEACDTLDPHAIRQRALDLYSLDAVAPQYDAYLNRLVTLHGDGWYER